MNDIITAIILKGLCFLMKIKLPLLNILTDSCKNLSVCLFVEWDMYTDKQLVDQASYLTLNSMILSSKDFLCT